MRGLVLMAVLAAGGGACGGEPVAGAGGGGGAAGVGGAGGQGGAGGGVAVDCVLDLDCSTPGEINCSVCRNGVCVPQCESSEECVLRADGCNPGDVWTPGMGEQPSRFCDPTVELCCDDPQGMCCAEDGCRALVCYFTLESECSSRSDCPPDRPICAYQGRSCSTVCSTTDHPG